ncbi:MAG: SPOR domain-containing protein [Sphingomonadales bacterium]|nr:SPOR domain-containing protein [Sphingomonadales bacterium]
MRLTIGLVLLFVLLGVAPAEAQLFRKIFSKSGGRDRNKEQKEEPVAAPIPTPVLEEPVPVPTPAPAVRDTLTPDKPVNRSPATATIKRETASGFRIQIYNGPNRTEAMRLKQEMESAYPNMNVHLVYRQPNFRVRIGDFRNHREAEVLLSEFRQLGFKTSFVVPDEIYIE